MTLFPAFAYLQGMLHAAQTIVSKEGISGLWRGTLPAVQRAALVNLGELATYDQVGSKQGGEGRDEVGFKTTFSSCLLEKAISCGSRLQLKVSSSLLPACIIRTWKLPIPGQAGRDRLWCDPRRSGHPCIRLMRLGICGHHCVDPGRCHQDEIDGTGPLAASVSRRDRLPCKECPKRGVNVVVQGVSPHSCIATRDQGRRLSSSVSRALMGDVLMDDYYNKLG